MVSESAKGLPMKETIVLARQYVQDTIADDIAVGHRPLNHWADESIDVNVD